jgi:GPH family glycoside/pentoside/hexuronide:cation symporter
VKKFMGENELEIKHSKIGMVSYGFNSFSREMLRIAFTTLAFFFYQTEVGLDVWWTATAFIIFAVYNMFNDPLIGYFTNRPFKFTKRWGRRFPWILIGGIPWGFTYILVFTPPLVDPVNGAWLLFIWLVFSTCLFDTFHSILFVNFQSLFTDKYRSVQERRTASGIYILIGVFGVALGSIGPPLFFDYGVQSSYIVQGVVIFIFTTVGFLLAIPGSREDQVTIDLYLKSQEENPHRETFFKTLFIAIKQKPFIIFMVMYTLYQSLVETMQAAVQFTVKYSLEQPESANTLVFAFMLIGVLIGSPLWTIYSRRVKNNKKVMTVTALCLIVTTLPLTFLRGPQSYWGVVINMLFWGMALGGFWIMIFPVSADVIDNSIVLTKRREEGIYTGFQQFFGRLGIIFQALTFAIVQTLTGFNPNAPVGSHSDLAILGVHLQQSLVPMCFLIIGTFVFWKWYPLTPGIVNENELRIKEMGL